MLHPYALDRDVMSDSLRRFCQLMHVVIRSLLKVSQVRATTVGSTVYALVWRAYGVQLQQQPLLCAFLIRFDYAVLGLEFLGLIGGLHVLHALSVVVHKRRFAHIYKSKHKKYITKVFDMKFIMIWMKIAANYL